MPVETRRPRNSADSFINRIWFIANRSNIYNNSYYYLHKLGISLISHNLFDCLIFFHLNNANIYIYKLMAWPGQLSFSKVVTAEKNVINLCVQRSATKKIHSDLNAIPFSGPPSTRLYS